MSEEIKKVPVNIADKDLDEVAAGAPGDPIGGIDVGLRKRPVGGQVTSSRFSRRAGGKTTQPRGWGLSAGALTARLLAHGDSRWVPNRLGMHPTAIAVG